MKNDGLPGTDLDRAEAISQDDPSFNVGAYAGQQFENTVPAQTYLRFESQNDLVGKVYEDIVTNLKDRYQIYKDTLNFADNPAYKDGDMPPGAAMLMQKLANVYSETKSFETFGNADKIDLKTYFDDLISLAPGRKPESLMVFKPNDKALTEAVKLYENRPDLAKDIFIGWSSAPAAAKEYSTKQELGIMGWGNMSHLGMKKFPWILNGNLEDLPEETRKEMEANVEANNPGDIKVHLKTTTGKMSIPGIGNILPQFGNEKIDFTYAYDEWIGKLYDPKTRTFAPNVVPQPLLLPQNIKGSIFEESNLDINKYRFMGSDQFSLRQIVSDPGKAQDLMDYYSAIINKDDAEKQKILPNLKGAFKYRWNNRRWIGASFGAIPALNQDLDDAKANPVDITTFILKQAENLLTGLGVKAGRADTGFAALRGSSISDNELPSVVRNLAKGALRLFGSRNIPGFAKNWLYSYIGRVPFMQNMNPAFAKNVSQNIAGVLDQAGGSVDKILSNGNWNPRVYDYLKETWTLLAGASKAFAGLGSGNTRFIAQIRDLGQDTGIMDLFRSMGGSLSIGKLMGLSLNQNWENLVDGALKDSKIKQIGAGGTLTDLKELPTDVKGLINLIFNPYNEFASVSTRSNLIDNFVTDLFNYRGNNPMMGRNVGANPVIDRNTMDWIKERTDALKVWYAGDGNQWVGQDYLYDKNLEPDDSIRIKGLSTSLANAGLQYYDMANRAHIELGLGEKFGPLPGQDWFAARSAQGFQTGGVVYADKGGHMVNFQPRGTDTVPAMLTPGEFVINKAATQKHLPLLTAINDGVQPYNVGGVVYAQTGGRPSLRRELPSTKPRPQVIDPKDIPDVEIPESVVKTPEQPKRGSGGRKYGSLDMGFGSGSIEHDGEQKKKLDRSKSPRDYGPIDMQGFEIDNELPSVDGRNNKNKGKQGIPPPFIRKNISPTAKSLGGIVYAQTGGEVQANRGAQPIQDENQIVSKIGVGAEKSNNRDKFFQQLEAQQARNNRLITQTDTRTGRQVKIDPISKQVVEDTFIQPKNTFSITAEKIQDNIIDLMNNWNNGIKSPGLLDDLSTALDVAGLVPVLGNFADIANIGVNLLRGDVTSAGLSALAAVPGLGLAAGVAKIGMFKGSKAIQILKNIDTAANLGQLGYGAVTTGQEAYDQIQQQMLAPTGVFAVIRPKGSSQVLPNGGDKVLFEGINKQDIEATIKSYLKANKIDPKSVIPEASRQKFPNWDADAARLGGVQTSYALQASRAASGSTPKPSTTASSAGSGDDTKKPSPSRAKKWVRPILWATGAGTLAAAIAAWWSSGRDAGQVREAGRVGPAIEPEHNIDLPGVEIEGGFTPQEIAEINKEVDEQNARRKAKRLAEKTDRRNTKLNRLTKKNADGIPLLIADAYPMIRNEPGTFLMRLFDSNTWRKLKPEERNRILSNPKLEDLKGNLNDEKTVKHVLDYLSNTFNGHDPEELKKKFLDDDKYYNRGGMVYANNGMLVPYQPKGTDTVPAMLTPGEFVVNRAATQKNLPLLKDINNGAKGYANGGVVYLQQAGLVPMTPQELEDAAGDPRQRNPRRRPLNRQEQQEKQRQDREAKHKANQRNKNFLSLSPMLRQLVYEIINMPQYFDSLNSDAINEALTDVEVSNKANEKIKEAVGDQNKQKTFMALSKDAFNRFTQLMTWHINSTKALSTGRGGLPRTIGDFTEKHPNESNIALKDVLSTQKEKSLKEAAAIRNGWIKLAEDHANQLFNGISPEALIANIIRSASAPKAFNEGGVVYANNGMLIPYQPRGTDTVPAMLTPGEFVVNREATQQNLGLLRAINSGSYQTGGVVKYLSEGTAGGISFERILSSFSSSINSVTSALSGLLTTLQNAPKGVNNDGNASVGGLDGLSQFTAKFDQFITQLSKLNLPPEININGNHKVDVVINGAQALQELLNGPLSGLIRQEVQAAFDRLSQESEGSIPNPTKR